ncbi:MULTISPECIES: hypothetical protein [unclassified Bartonella]|uniref:hypothetical protein n=1 Tax=unclassified Bartonella TaxID=2645622 RepID=UPI00235F2BA4|nr:MULTISPECIES: hypothetical protein [unclassified Bartonella]
MLEHQYFKSVQVFAVGGECARGISFVLWLLVTSGLDVMFCGGEYVGVWEKGMGNVGWGFTNMSKAWGGVF